MAANSPLMDLDFTKPLAQAAAAPALGEHAPDPQSEIGGRRTDIAGNFIYYVRSGAPRAAASADAPILIVEDDEDTRHLLDKVLRLQGFPVRAAADSREFQQELRKPPLPCLILLDVELPRVSGFKLLTVLRQHPQTSGIPVVLVTARSANKDLLYGLSLGADGYLSKPFTVESLCSLVQKVLRGPA